jgi:hypothetical protein
VKNPAPAIRSQLYALLNEAVPYEGSLVPVFEGGGEAKPYKIIIAEMSPFPRLTKASQSHTYDVIVEVVYEGPDNVRRHIDAIAEQVMDKVKPNLYTTGFIDTELWQYTGVNVNAPRYLDDLSADYNYIKRALVTINFLIVQRTY